MKKKQQTSVTLRKRLLSDKKKYSLYLDLYPGIEDTNTGKVQRRIYLNSYITVRPKTDLERQLNDERLTAANAERLKIEAAIQRGEYGKPKSNIFLFEYFENYVSSKKISASIYNGCLQFLFEFTNKQNIKVADISDSFVKDFREYLINAKNRKNGKPLSKNSAANYFVVFRAVLHQAFKEKLLSEDIRARHENIKKTETRREFLTLDELRKLAQTNCNSEILKRAFIFSALTGLRYSDVQSLKWQDISTDNGQTYIYKRIVKNKGMERLPLTDDALQYMGERSSDTANVFEGIEYSYHMNNDLRYWAASAGINRHITFHSARHTFATLQITLGTDIYTVSKMLGHKELATTQIYAKLIDKKKIEAVNRIKL
ncbi:MAG: site-specific integrase [Lentimicrobiaceae bacterium]|nr:site-specific integrase [Lentimicrobiaceae bacterium]